ncbi:MAG TPA: aldo/keto reductase, partial [Terriglobales bacterium]|nr:aldo/keto reductase [Terriglobales bacterium]
KIVPIVSVQNRYSFADREWDGLVNRCDELGIAFMPWAPLRQNRETNSALEDAAAELKATPFQIALAWLLRRSRIMLPIPGTSSVSHLEENIAAGDLMLPESLFASLSAITPAPATLRG